MAPSEKLFVGWGMSLALFVSLASCFPHRVMYLLVNQAPALNYLTENNQPPQPVSR